MNRFREWLKKFKKDQRAVTVNEIVMLTVGFFLVGILAPIAISEIANASVVNWNASVTTIFQTVLPIIYVIGVAVRYIPKRA